jgi:hypothetical protein
VQVLKGRQQREAGTAEAPEAGELHMAVALQALAGTARLEHPDADGNLYRDARDTDGASAWPRAPSAWGLSTPPRMTTAASSGS